MEKKRIKKLAAEFKTFISRGNVMDMAVGVIVGSAFTNIVNSLVNDLFMPIISLITGSVDFTKWQIQIGTGENPAMIRFGVFFSSVLHFLLIAVVVFCFIKIVNKIKLVGLREDDEDTEKDRECPYCKLEIAVEAVRCPHCTSLLPILSPESEVRGEGTDSMNEGSNGIE